MSKAENFIDRYWRSKDIEKKFIIAGAVLGFSAPIAAKLMGYDIPADLKIQYNLDGYSWGGAAFSSLVFGLPFGPGLSAIAYNIVNRAPKEERARLKKTITPLVATQTQAQAAVGPATKLIQDLGGDVWHAAAKRLGTRLGDRAYRKFGKQMDEAWVVDLIVLEGEKRIPARIDHNGVSILTRDPNVWRRMVNHVGNIWPVPGGIS